MKKTLMILFAILLGLYSCGFAEESEMFTNRDLDASYDESTAVQIILSGDSATASSNSVIIKGKIIQITEEATYLISGTLNDGMLVVNASEKANVQIVFNGVQINSATCAPLYVLEADKVFVTLADGTENVLSNGGSFEPIDANAIDAAIYSKADLTFNGSGSLTVTSPAGHGIAAKDDLVFTGGTYHIDAASHGVDANDSVRVTQADLTVTAGKDGVRAENADDMSRGFVFVESGSLHITAEGDGISAGAYMQINGGMFEILAGGGYENGTQESSDHWGHFGGRGHKGGGPNRSEQSAESAEDSSTSMKGVKAEGNLIITDGTFHIDAADDAIHSNTSVTVSGGTFAVASGDDAFHAEENLSITGGVIDISHSYEGLEALHVEVAGGDIRLVASDDGLNAAGGNDDSGTTGGRDGRFGGGHRGWGSANSDGTIVISGGTLYVNASGDGIDANGTLLISGGQTTVVGPLRGDTTVLDYDLSGEITGGVFVGTGSSMMAQSLSGSGQGVIGVSVGQQEAGAEIVLRNKGGAALLTSAPELPYEILIFSSPELVAGETYTLSVGTLSGDITAN